MPIDPAPYRWFDATQDRQRSIFEAQRELQRDARGRRIQVVLFWCGAVPFGLGVFWFMVFQVGRYLWNQL